MNREFAGILGIALTASFGLAVSAFRQRVGHACRGA